MQLFSTIADKITQHDGLTVPEVSGVIAAGIFVVQFFIPLALPLILLALLREKNSVATTSAVTWSVVGTFIHASLWPGILGADSESTTSVPTRVTIVTKLKKFLVILVAIAGVVTPLGLYEKIVASSSPTPSAFHYVHDPSPFGFATPPRDNLPFSRICGFPLDMECPNSFSNITVKANDTGMYSWVEKFDTTVPQYVIDAFQSGLSAFNRSVSSIFDIQPRQYKWSQQAEVPDVTRPDNGSSYPQGLFRQISSLIMERKVTLVEGLIVDMDSGGVGFRNHSAPPLKPFGSEWTEDILFVEPESVCVDTNLTLDFSLAKYYSQNYSDLVDLVLTDRGGFANHPKEIPDISENDTQSDPKLHERAHRAALFNNGMTMAYMNVTNPKNLSDPTSEAYQYIKSTVGKTFPLMSHNSSSSLSFNSLGLSPYKLLTSREFGNYLPGLTFEPTFSNSSSNSSWSPETLYPNPFHISTNDFADINDLCSGASARDIANMSNFAAQCGLLYGAPRPQDGASPLVFTPGSNWSIPLYSCISASKAVIKTVKFRFNSSNDLSGETVAGISEKAYPDKSSQPLWGVELTDMELQEASPLWGLVSSPNQGNISLSTLRKESLYLPGYVPAASWGVIVSENLPGVNFHANSLARAYEIGTGSDSDTPTIHYTGESNIAMFRLWQEYSLHANNAARILNLVWTDYAANTVVGTRGMHDQDTNAGVQKRQTSSSQDDLYPVKNYHRRIRYHIPYGIPAFIVLFFTAIIFACTILSCLCKSGPGKMKRYLTKTSQGRILTARLYGTSSPPPEYSSRGFSRTKDWRDTIGRKEISLSQQQPEQVVIHDSKFAERTEPLLEQGGMYMPPK